MAHRMIVITSDFRVIFGRVNPTALLSDSASSNYRHIESDLASPDHLLFIDNNSIKVVSPTTLVTHVIAGGQDSGYRDGHVSQTKFNSPFSFYQPNSSAIIVADTGNFCLRIINRETNQTSTYAGNCTEPGFQSGSPSDARFGAILDIVRLPRSVANKLVITDYRPNNRLCTVDLQTRVVQTFAQLYVPPLALAWHPIDYSLFLSFEGGLGKYNLLSRKLDYLTPTDHKTFGHLDGQLASAKFSASILSMKFINENTLILADHLNNVI